MEGDGPQLPVPGLQHLPHRLAIRHLQLGIPASQNTLLPTELGTRIFSASPRHKGTCSVYSLPAGQWSGVNTGAAALSPVLGLKVGSEETKMADNYFTGQPFPDDKVMRKRLCMPTSGYRKIFII